MRRKLAMSMGMIALGLGAAACGSGGAASNGVASKSPPQILTTTIAAMKSAKSVMISGNLTKAGQSLKLSTASFSNGDLDGSFTENGKTFNVIKVGATDYIKAASSFYQAQGAPVAVANKMGGVWVSIPDTQMGLGAEFGLSGFANSINKDHGTITAGTTSSIGGQPVVSIHSSKGGTLFVATTGTAFPIQLTDSGAALGSGVISFTQWNQATEPTVPAGSKPASSFG